MIWRNRRVLEREGINFKKPKWSLMVKYWQAFIQWWRSWRPHSWGTGIFSPGTWPLGWVICCTLGPSSVLQASSTPVATIENATRHWHVSPGGDIALWEFALQGDLNETLTKSRTSVTDRNPEREMQPVGLGPQVQHYLILINLDLKDHR